MTNQPECSDDVCFGCRSKLGDDSMIGGDGKTGCDVNPRYWHEKCFYGRFGYID